jgi:hypothetical protein
MMTLNWPIILATGLVPLAVGAIWYGPLFGKTWQRLAEIDDSKMREANMLVLFGLTILAGMLLAVGLTPLVIHQLSIFSVLQNTAVQTEGSPDFIFAQQFMASYGNAFRTFGHGALHGFMAALLIGSPVMVVNGLFERKKINYLLLNMGYWVLVMALMGGCICAYA